MPKIRMLNIFRKTTENERKEENWRLDEVETRWRQDKTSTSDADLRCEEAIIKDKERFGRVRTSLMKHLRMEYGRDTADRALRRVNKRMTEGYLKGSS